MSNRLIDRLCRMLDAAGAPAERLALLTELARQHARVIDLDTARGTLAQAQALFERTPLPAQADDVAHASAVVLYISGQLTPAIAELGKARAAASEAGHAQWVARCDATMVLFLARFGAQDAARECAQRALAAARAADDAQALYTVWLGLGALARNQCDVPAAREAYAQARQYAGVLDDDLAVRTVLHHLVGLAIERVRMGALAAPDVPGTRAEVATALMFAEHDGSQIGMVQARIALAMLERAEDRPQPAAEQLDALADQADALAMLEECIVARTELAHARRMLGDADGAVRAARAAHERAERSGILRLQTLATGALVDLLDAPPDAEEAAQMRTRMDVLRQRSAQLQREDARTLRALIGPCGDA